ncbi:MAG: hypothetical protein ACO24O_08090 [Arenimonas sp.]
MGENFTRIYAQATEDMRQWLDERAAIREFDGNQTRAEAEAGAVEDWQRHQDRRGQTDNVEYFKKQEADHE